MSKRFYHIAHELGVPPRAFIRDLARVGLSVGNQMVVVPTQLEQRIREVWEKLKPLEAPVAEVVATATATEAAPSPGQAVEPTSPVYEEEFEVPHEEPPIGTPAEEVPVGLPEIEAEAPAAATAAAVSGAASGTVPTEAPARAARRRREREGGGSPATGDLVPTIDPRAGRLVREAPKSGVPGITPPPPPRGVEMDLNPTIPQAPRAPGARRESHRRSTVPERYRTKRGKETFHMRKRSRKTRPETVHVRPTSIEVEPPVSLKRFSELSGLKAADIIKLLFTKHKMLVNVNAMLDQDALELICLELDLDLKITKRATAEDSLLARVGAKDAPEHLMSRPPVVTILGHVDHGKTTLLDRIRATDVASREAGGITQHIGASQITLDDGRKVTFIDTPGHEAFTEMRARGAQVTDVVVLVVAADDGVMPQTVEAISHAKAAEVPIVVAVTKVDKGNANPARVRQQLSEHGIYAEGWGGDVSAFDVSGVTGQGVDALLEHLALLAEVESERFQANPDRMAEGTVIEAENSPQRGVVATVLVQNGALRRGDAVLAGEAWGAVRALFNYRGVQVQAALPGDPVEVIGLDQPPEAGAKLYVLADTNEARTIAENRRQKTRERELAAQSKPTTVESLFGKIEEGKVKELNVVLKVDVKGSLEPIRTMLDRIGTEEVRVRVIHSAVGAVNDSDVILASASNAMVIGFNVNADEKARGRAKSTGVETRIYRVIYEIDKDVRDLLEGKLAPEEREIVQGHVEVLKVFSSSRLGNIAGCRVRDGLIRRDSLVRVKRGGNVLHSGKIASLRREKDEVREVKEGFECGIRVDGWDTWQESDEIEAYTIEEVARKLA